MIKKSIALLSLAVMTASPVAMSADTQLRMSWWGGNSRHEATNDAVNAFEMANPSIAVKTEYTGWGGHLERLTTQIAGNTEPDVMQVNWNWLPIFSTDGTGFTDLRQYGDIIDLDQFDASALNMVSKNGKLNGIPISMSARIFYFNETVWQKAGLAYPTTWDELFAAGPAFKEKLGDEYFPLVFEGRDALALIRAYMVQKYGVGMIDEANKKIAYSDEQMLEFFQFYKKLVDNHVVPSTKYIASYGNANLYEHKPWIKGEWAGLYMWNSAINKYNDNLMPPMKMALADHPMLEGATDSGIFYKPGMMFSIGKNSENPKEAAKLINYLLNEPTGIELMGLARAVPMSKAARDQLTAQGALNSSDLTVAGLAQINALPKVIPASPHFDNPKFVSLFQEAIDWIDHGEKSVEEAAEDFMKQGNRIVRRAIR